MNLGRQPTNSSPRTERLSGEFDLDPELTIAWIDALLARPPLELGMQAHALVELLQTRNELVRRHGRPIDRYRPADLHPAALHSLHRLFRQVLHEQRARLAHLREAALAEPKAAPPYP